MGKGKRKAPSAAGAGGPKERRRRAQRSRLDPLAPVPEGLVAKPAVPRSKHQTYFEFVENKEKKKKLEFQVTQNKSPPPGFEFVPIGNPELTTTCKELSREHDAMIFIVSSVTTNTLSQQVNRLGHHIRQTIVEEARSGINSMPNSGAVTPDGKPEPIPTSQAEYHVQADAALRDLFPRIPHTDRQMIIEHAFTRSIQRQASKGEQPVGFSDDIPLARRVQLAVLAHIRHSHTRYDDLLREAGWQSARRAVEALCLDIIVKWRGDEETGRDQLDEILREVVVISDSEDDDSEEDTTENSSLEDADSAGIVFPGLQPISHGPSSVNLESELIPVPPRPPPTRSLVASGKEPAHVSSQHRRVDRKNQRGFKRYRAWEEAIMRNREADLPTTSFVANTASAYDLVSHQRPPQDHQIQHNQDLHNGMRYHGSSSTIVAIPDHNRLSDIGPSLTHQVTDAPNSRFEDASNSRQASRLSPVTNSFRDLLVPSIEPPSRESMRPSFVRAVPPRQPDGVGVHVRPTEQYGPRRSLSPSGDQIRTMGNISIRRVFSDHVPDSRRPCDIVVNEASGAAYARRTEVIYPQRPVTLHDPAHHYWTRSQGEVMAMGQLPAERIIINASRPGTRANPIVMEDRGGFYERIVAPPETRQMPAGYGANILEMPRVTVPTTYSRHRIVSSEEGALLLQESRGEAGVEVIPLSGSRTLAPFELQPNSNRHQNSGEHMRSWHSNPGSWSNLPQAGHGNNRPVSVQYPVPNHPQLYQPVDGPSLSESEHQIRAYRGKRPAPDDHYQEMSRSRRPRSQQPDDIIVID